MTANTLTVKTRKELKKSITKRLRNEGQIPAVVYGYKEPISISISEREFEKKYHSISENIIITLIEDGNEIAEVLIKDYQEDITTERIQHLDFYEVERGKVLKAKVPVGTEGSSIGVKMGGILEQLVHEIEVECLPKDIPVSITINIENLDIGDSIHISYIEKPEGVKFMISEDQIVAHIVRAKEIIEETEEEAEEAEEAETSETEGE